MRTKIAQAEGCATRPPPNNVYGRTSGGPVRTCGPRLGAALFTVFVKGAGLSVMSNPQRAKEERFGIGQWEKRMERKKTRTLERQKDAAPKVQKYSKAGAPGT